MSRKYAEICMINLRLREERQRLRMNQTEFAAAAGAKIRTMQDWEKGVSCPTVLQLKALGAIGVDVVYVLTGEHRSADEDRKLAVAKVAAIPIAMGFDSKKAKVVMPDIIKLSDKEIELIVNYRKASEDGKLAIETTANALAKQADK